MIKKISSIVLILLILIGAYQVIFNDDKKIEARFAEAIDGDSFYLYINDKKQEVRLLAINTPECNKNEEGAFEAKEYTTNLLKNAKRIEIETDENSDEYDKYDRLLVWVFVDKKLLQEEILKQGLGEIAYVYGDYKYLDRLYKINNN